MRYAIARLPLAILLAADLLAVASKGEAQRSRSEADACRRPSPRSFAMGASVDVRSSGKYPCRIVFNPTTLMLRADEAGTVADIVRLAVLRDRSGRFYTATGQGSITVWDRSGNSIRTLGRAGNGPGEFGRTWAVAHTDPTGRVYIRDDVGRWSIFGADLSFQRTSASIPMGFSPEFSTFIDDGLFLSATPMSADPDAASGDSGSFFHVYDFWSSRARASGLPERIRSFGAVPSAERGVPTWQLERPISYAGGQLFWAGPPSFVGRGYEIELWTVGGERIRTLRREIGWFPKGADKRAVRASEGNAVVRPAAVGSIHADGSGLVVVAVTVPNSAFKQPPGRRTPSQLRQDRDESQLAYLEVIDADAGVVLASEGPMRPSEFVSKVVSGFFPRSMTSYLFGTTQSGLPTVSIREMTLRRAGSD
jgi:hypothetical protein